MISHRKLETLLNHLLEPHAIKDYCPNGLQVEGRERIRRVVTGVTASQALIDAAVAAIEAGEFAGTVAWDPLWTGGMGLAIPYAHATGKIDITKEPKEHREFYGTGIIVTKDTVAGYKANPPKVDFNDLWGKATGQIQYRG